MSALALRLEAAASHSHFALTLALNPGVMHKVNVRTEAMGIPLSN